MVHNGIANQRTVIRKLHQKFPMTVLGFYNCICLDRLPDATRTGFKNYSSASMPHGLKALAPGVCVPSLAPPVVGAEVPSGNPETALLLIPLPDSDAKRLSMSISFSFIEGFTYIFFIAV